MFGKKYDEEIEKIRELVLINSGDIHKLLTMQNQCLTTQNNLVENIISIATILAQHKKCMSFLLKHSQLDSDAQESFKVLLTELNKLEKQAKNVK